MKTITKINNINKITETRVLTMEALRKLCIDKGWYTEGTNEDYNNLLLSVKNMNMTAENIYKVAIDIICHTNLYSSGYYIPDDEVLTSIMYDITDACYSYYTVE